MVQDGDSPWGKGNNFFIASSAWSGGTTQARLFPWDLSAIASSGKACDAGKPGSLFSPAMTNLALKELFDTHVVTLAKAFAAPELLAEVASLVKTLKPTFALEPWRVKYNLDIDGYGEKFIAWFEARRTYAQAKIDGTELECIVEKGGKKSNSGKKRRLKSSVCGSKKDSCGFSASYEGITAPCEPSTTIEPATKTEPKTTEAIADSAVAARLARLIVSIVAFSSDLYL
eukprot:gnl/TRDRNA2_/TRDRNA2_206269_c0_seq1.p1 gnl/TRDRNA2_/TRDRNA2_206269_c0~~gnl/TRDRNA2_/TRDRNA2_206269_c0_seq1.p1  ORF type:complete len:258 (+),score=46.75 gnl/TRDRNA2_/TRDRNA2_206269_c0_seq1:89-775(+)